MIQRISGTFFGKPFTGTLDIANNVVTFDRALEHRLPIMVQLVPHDRIVLDELSFHKRHKVFLGEIMIGWIVDRGNDWVAEPINHGFLNPDGEPGEVSRSYQDWAGVHGFFRYSLPEPCRTHLRVVEQTIEHAILAACKGTPSASKS